MLQGQTAVVVDDEELSRTLLRTLIERESSLTVVAECGGGCAAIDAITKYRPDVVFLDVQMPDVDGIGVARALADRSIATHIVFVTAYDRYAITAFELNVVDYLVKPIEKGRFRQTVERVENKLRRDTVWDLSQKVHDLSDALRGSGDGGAASPDIVIRSGDRVDLVQLEDIQWVEAANQYVRIHANDREYVMSETLKRFRSRLDDERFVRVHRSAVINCNKLASVKRRSGGLHLLTLENGDTVTLARSRARLLPEIMKRAKKLHGAGDIA